MDITCPQCNGSYALEVAKPRADKPPYLSEEGKGKRFTWWGHNQPYDLRLLGALLAVGVIWGASRLAFDPQWTAGLKDTQRDWASLAAFLTVCAIAIALLGFLLKAFFLRRHLECDGVRLRATQDPIASQTVEIPYRQVKQLYVTSQGELICQTRNGQNLSLTSGTPAAMRYIEQSVEERLEIEDEQIPGEWRASRWMDALPTPCPHCQFLPTVVHPVVFEVQPHAKVRKRILANGIELSWNWRAWWLIPVGVWLLFWDTGILPLLKQSALFFFMPHVWVALGGTYTFFAYLFNQAIITSEGGAVRIACTPLPWFGWPKQYAAGQLRQLFVVQKTGNKGQVSYSLQAQTVGGDTLTLIGYGEDGALLRYVEQEIERQLNIKNVPVAGEWEETT